MSLKNKFYSYNCFYKGWILSNADLKLFNDSSYLLKLSDYIIKQKNNCNKNIESTIFLSNNKSTI